MPNDMEIALKADRERGFSAETDKLTINCEASLKAIGVASGPDRPRRESPKLCDPIRAEAEAMRFRCRVLLDAPGLGKGTKRFMIRKYAAQKASRRKIDSSAPLFRLRRKRTEVA